MFEIGETAGDYQIIGILGAGGMGKVYKVRNVISDRVEAMKILLPNLEADAELADRFMREIKVQASLNHPNIASLHTAVRQGNQLLMVMEYVEGRTIESLLREGPVPLANGIHYVLQVLSALSYAHARGVVHRDIKPANMMLTPEGVVKLMDFGIARVAKSDQKLTQTGHTVGSLFYMSPEQIQGGQVDARADLYSLGVSLYEIVTGRKPYQGDSDYSIMAAHLKSVPVPPIEIDPKLPASLNDIILMALAKDPGQRFQTAEAFGNALLSVYNGIVGGAPAKAAAAAAAADPGPAPVSQPAAAKSGHRGLYMVAGSLATIAVLALAVTQAPKWLKTRASGDGSPAAQSQTQNPSSGQPADPASGQAAGQQPVQQPAEQPPVQQPAPAPETPTANPAQREQAKPMPSSKGSPIRPRVAAQTPAQQAQQAPAQQPPAQQPQSLPQTSAPAQDQARAAALKELRHQMMLMGARIGAVKSSLDTLKREQARQGLSLRGDIVAKQGRVDYLMDEAEAALKAGDPTTARGHLDMAERVLGELESFLGR